MKFELMLTSNSNTGNRDSRYAYGVMFLCITALGTFAMAARSVVDPDVWWHLRTGQLILQNHAIFYTDPYSFTAFGRPWINHEWLSDVLMYGLYSMGSWPALIVAFACFASVALVLAFLRCKASPAVAAMVTICCATATMPSLGARPQVISFLLIGIFLAILDWSEQRPSILAFLPLLMLFWVNLHAGYAAGIALIVIYLAGAALDAAFGIATWEQANIRLQKLGMVLIVCLAVIPLNPYGFKMFGYPFETLRSQAMQNLIQEWASPNFHELKHAPALVLLLAILAIFALKPRRVLPSEILLLLATVMGAMFSVRHIPILALAAIPILSRMLQEQVGEFSQIQTSNLRLDPRKLILNGAIVVGLLVFVTVRVIRLNNLQLKSETANFPTGAVTFLLEQNIKGRLLNPYDWGGYLIWKLYPNTQVFIDGRADVYGDKLIDQSVASYYLRGSWDIPLKSWPIKTALLPAQAPLVQGLQAHGWGPIYADHQAVVLQHSD